MFLCVAAPSFAADMNACITRCTERMADCTKTCKDDKCVRRCADQLMPCQSQCEQQPASKNSKGKNNDMPPPPRGTAGWGKTR